MGTLLPSDFSETVGPLLKNHCDTGEETCVLVPFTNTDHLFQMGGTGRAVRSVTGTCMTIMGTSTTSGVPPTPLIFSMKKLPDNYPANSNLGAQFLS